MVKSVRVALCLALLVLLIAGMDRKALAQGGGFTPGPGGLTLTTPTLTSPTINAGAMNGTITGAPYFSGGPTIVNGTLINPTISSPTLSGDVNFNGDATFGADIVSTTLANAPMLGTDTLGNFRAITLGTNLSFGANGVTLNASSPAPVTWPDPNSLLISNSTNSPAGLDPVNNALLYGTGNAWMPLAAVASSVPCWSVTGVMTACSAATLQGILGYLTTNQAITVSGDASGSGQTSIALTNTKLNGVAAPASPATNTIPYVSSSNQITYGNATTILGVLGVPFSVPNGGSGLATLTSGAIYKGAGTANIVASGLSDNSSIISTSEPFDLTNQSQVIEIANASSVGTTNGLLAKLTGAPSAALTLLTSDTDGALGVVVSGGGTTGNALIAIGGQANCSFDAATTAGDWVIISSTAAGKCHDTGSATRPGGSQAIGRVLTTNAGGPGSYAMIFSLAFTNTAGSPPTWPASASIVISNTTNTPAGLAPVANELLYGTAAPAWAALPSAASAVLCTNASSVPSLCSAATTLSLLGAPFSVPNGGWGLTTLTSGAIYKGNGTSAPTVSGLSDNGTVVSTTEPIDLTTRSAVIEIPNASSGGTTAGLLAKLSAAPSTALTTLTTDTDGAIGIVIGGGGTTGSAQIAVNGQASCTFDGATTAGHFVTISGTVPGNCHDGGASRPSGVQSIGQVLSTNGAGGSFPVELSVGFASIPGSPPTWPATGDIVVSNSTNTPAGLAPVASSVPCWSATTVLSACSSATLQTILGYLTGNQTITLGGDASGSGTTSITVTNPKLNGVAYPALPATNTVPAVTSSNQVTYETGAGLAALPGFGTMLTQNASAVAITGGSIIGTTINGPSNTITNIANASLANSSMTLAGHVVPLGATQAFAIGDLSNIGAGTIVGNSTGIPGVPVALSTAQISTMLGLGTMATQNASAVAITGGSITGTTINGPSNTITNIANGSLANSSMTLAGHSVSLGGTQAFAIGDLSTIGATTIVGNNTIGAAVPVALSTAQVSTMLGLGTMATQNAGAVAITGGTITGTTINGASNTITNIANASLVNSSISVAGHSISLGGANQPLAIGDLSTIAATTIVGNNTGVAGVPLALTTAQVSTMLGLGTMATQNASAVAITGGTIIGSTINGSSNTISNIANASLTNSSMTLAGHSVALGGTQTFAIGDLSTIGATTIVGNNTGIAGVPLALTTAQVKTMLGEGTLASQNANALNVTGVTALTGLPTCSAASDACPKSYIDGAVVGSVLHPQVAAATPGAVLPNTPVASGTGPGKTLTSATNTPLVVDGYSVLLNDRVLVKDQAAPADNGIYAQTTLGSVGGAVKWVLTRATDFDTAIAGEVALGAYVFVANGTVNIGTQWQLGAPTPASITVDTTALTFNKLNSNSTLIADGTTIQNIGGTISVLQNGVLNAVTATPNSLIARGASTWAGVAPVNNAVLVTSAAGVPSESTTLPSGLTIPGYLTGNQTITLSGATTGSGTTAITTALASVADATLLSNISGGSAAPSANTLTAIIDHDIGSTANSLLQRGASTWALMPVVNNAVVVTSAVGVASESATLPSGLTIPGYLTANQTITLSGATTGSGTTAITTTLATAADATLLSNISGGVAAPSSNTLTAIIDHDIAATANSLLARGVSTWGAVAAVNNAVLSTNGTGVPSESTTLPSGLTIPGYLTGNQTITVSGAVTGSGTTAITTALASVADATLLSNISGGSAAPSANTLTAIIDHDITATANSLLVRGATTWGAVTPVNNAVLSTSGTGVPSESTTLPSGLTIPGYLTANQTITIGGDSTGSGTTSITLANTKVNGVNYPTAPATNTIPFISSANQASYGNATTILSLLGAPFSVANGGTGLTTLTAGAIYKGNGTSSPTVTGLSDNGTFVSTSEPIDLTTKSAVIEVPNAGTGGTTAGLIAKLSGAPSAALTTLTSDFDGAIGIVVGGGGTTGNAQIAVEGQAACTFDGGTTAGHFVTISGTVAGNCHDSAAARPTGVQVLGQVLTTNAAGGSYQVTINPQFSNTAGSGGSVSSPGTSTVNNIPFWTGTDVLSNTGVPFGIVGNNTLVETSGGGTIANSLISALPLANLATMADATLLSNISGSAAVPTANTLTAIIDHDIGATRGSMLERGASGWTAIVPGTTAFVWTSNGAAADPTWQALPSANISGLTAGQVGVAGTASTITSSIAFGTTGNNTLVETGAGGTIANSLISALPLANLATMADATLLSNITGGVAVPSANTLTAIISHDISSTRGALLENGASGWTGLNPSPTVGFVLTSNGTAADPTYQAPASGGISGLTSGQLAIAGSASTLTSSIAFSNVSSASKIGQLNASGLWDPGMLPLATAAAFGAVKCGANTTCTAGVISAAAGGSGSDTGTTGIAAGGTTLAAATDMTTQQNYVASGANCTAAQLLNGCIGSAAVRFDAALMVAFNHLYVCNEDPTFALLVYPDTTAHTINNQAAGAGIAIQANQCGHFIVKSATALRAVP